MHKLLLLLFPLVPLFPLKQFLIIFFKAFMLSNRFLQYFIANLYIYGNRFVVIILEGSVVFENK